MSDHDPRAIGGRLLDFCLAVLFAAVALYGAVLIVQAIWVWLFISAAIIAVSTVIWWLLRTRF